MSISLRNLTGHHDATGKKIKKVPPIRRLTSMHLKNYGGV